MSHGKDGGPEYATFDDYRHSQRIAVAVRWFLIVIWLALHNYRPDLGVNFVVLNGLGVLLAGVNGYVHWRV